MKQKTKRILAFAMAVVLLVNLRNLSPYTVYGDGRQEKRSHLLQKREAVVK